ncbi:phage holin family protein [Enterobacter kobei]|uniref:phage holin family protein n=1 Tax=Enterobacter kobei TaxID=208224 RepID=UPI0020067629|nr:phage holin family protein [Enterobacter kobei]MCK7182641.1 phage holin family protein [Enterobacter kobei]
MQNYTPPGGWGPALHFLHENRLALQGALTAFFIAMLFSLWDGVAWRRSFTAGFICGFVAIAVVSFFEQLGVSDMDWSFVIGAAVGGAGVDRCRSLINAAVTLFASKKGINDDKQL